MRLEVLRNELEKFLVNQYKFEPEFDEENEALIVSCNIKFRDFDDHVLLRIITFASGASTILFIFDKIELTLEVMLRINAFNEHVQLLKAYVNENGLLTFKHTIIDAVLESNINEALETLINVFVDIETRKHLDPLTEMTFSK